MKWKIISIILIFGQIASYHFNCNTFISAIQAHLFIWRSFLEFTLCIAMSIFCPLENSLRGPSKWKSLDEWSCLWTEWGITFHRSFILVYPDSMRYLEEQHTFGYQNWRILLTIIFVCVMQCIGNVIALVLWDSRRITHVTKRFYNKQYIYYNVLGRFRKDLSRKILV